MSCSFCTVSASLGSTTGGGVGPDAFTATVRGRAAAAAAGCALFIICGTICGRTGSVGAAAVGAGVGVGVGAGVGAGAVGAAGAGRVGSVGAAAEGRVGRDGIEPAAEGVGAGVGVWTEGRTGSVGMARGAAATGAGAAATGAGAAMGAGAAETGAGAGMAAASVTALWMAPVTRLDTAVVSSPGAAAELSCARRGRRAFTSSSTAGGSGGDTCEAITPSTYALNCASVLPTNRVMSVLAIPLAIRFSACTACVT
mmetsp:Transcript_28269/g.47418  ORF Transcript_28269/g.47418 Transcript_28269/m.47418 type:complete len:255 (+) Transcript_28269:2503-3267(+)